MAIDSAMLERLRSMSMMLPEVAEVELMGSPAFRVDTRTFASIEVHDGVPVILVKLPVEDQAALVATEGFEKAPGTGEHGWTLIRMDLGVEWRQVDRLVMASYRVVAPERLQVALDLLLVEAGEMSAPRDEPVASKVLEEAAATAPGQKRVVEIMEIRTDDLDAVLAVQDTWMAATADDRSSGRVLVCVDDADPGVVLRITEHTSRDEAEKLADHAATADLRAALGGLSDGELVVRTVELRRLDVL